MSQVASELRSMARITIDQVSGEVVFRWPNKPAAHPATMWMAALGPWRVAVGSTACMAGSSALDGGH